MNEEQLRVDINTRLWYALGDIEPTDEKMVRAVESIYSLFSSHFRSYQEELVKKIAEIKAEPTELADVIIYNTACDDIIRLIQEK